MTANANLSSRKCPACGANVLPDSLRCDNCGQAISESVKASEKAVEESAIISNPDNIRNKLRGVNSVNSKISTPNDSPSITQPLSASKQSVTLEGTVNRFQSRPALQFEIWTFQLEVTKGEERTSYLVQVGPGEMQGLLHNGEQLRVIGKFEEGVLHGSRLFSKTNNAYVGPRRRGFSTNIIMAVVSVLVIVGFQWHSQFGMLRLTIFAIIALAVGVVAIRRVWRHDDS